MKHSPPYTAKGFIIYDQKGIALPKTRENAEKIVEALNFYARFKKDAPRMSHREFEEKYLGRDTRDGINK
jgi:hypothetical protein